MEAAKMFRCAWGHGRWTPIPEKDNVTVNGGGCNGAEPKRGSATPQFERQRI